MSRSSTPSPPPHSLVNCRVNSFLLDGVLCTTPSASKRIAFKFCISVLIEDAVGRVIIERHKAGQAGDALDAVNAFDRSALAINGAVAP